MLLFVNLFSFSSDEVKRFLSGVAHAATGTAAFLSAFLAFCKMRQQIRVSMQARQVSPEVSLASERMRLEHLEADMAELRAGMKLVASRLASPPSPNGSVGTDASSASTVQVVTR